MERIQSISAAHPETLSSSFRQQPDRFILGLIVAFALVHLAMLAFVPDTAQQFMVGDRAGDRMAKLARLLSASTWDERVAALIHEGTPGDFALFAPAYALGGPVGVILQNIAAYLIGLWFLYRIGLLISPRIARIASIAWCLIPATVFHPQVFVSEAICNPLLIVATYILLRLLLLDRPRIRDAVILGLLVGVIVFVRYVYVLLPVMIAVVVLALARGRRSESCAAALSVLLLGYSFTGAASFAAATLASRYEVVDSISGLDANLYVRAERMAAIGRVSLPSAGGERKERGGHGLMTLREFAEFARERPDLYFRSVGADLFNFFANPGTPMLFGRYFRFFDLGDNFSGGREKWRVIRETQGFSALLHAIRAQTPTGLVIITASGMVWAAFLLMAAIGGLRFALQTRLPLALRVVLWALALYVIFVTCTTAGLARWDHRSPMEFVLALLFAFGCVQQLREREDGGRGALVSQTS